jgi:opacity protein-like surface antigen
MKKFFAVLFLMNIVLISHAQYEWVQKGEFGVTVGAAHYFGDLNTRAALNRPKPALGLFFRKQFGNYVGLRIGAHYAQLGYSDVYSKNSYQKARNLSFNSNIWEIAVQGDFNFFKFVPGDIDHLFTPYVTIGAGVFTYDPYAFLDGQKEFLRPLGTEGQNANFQGRKPYSTMAFCFPIGAGIKYNLSENVNISFEISHRVTTTDYLDDVSTTYAGITNFPTLANGNPSSAALLQDRSGDVLGPANALGLTPGRQRGLSKQKDQYIIAEVGISINLRSYRCPGAN